METKYSHAVVLCLLLFACLFIFIKFNNPDDQAGLIPSNFLLQNHRPSKSKTIVNETSSTMDPLESALSKASMENKTLIIAIVNKAYVEELEGESYGNKKTMLELFLDSFWFGEDTRGLINHLLLVAMDQPSFERCEFLRLRCFKLETEGVDFGGEKVYMSRDFIDMMWRRTNFLGEVLKRGYSFIFTDTDVLWLRNPFPKLSSNESIDLQISTDRFNGDPSSSTNPINTGFYMVRSNNKTVSLFDAWHARKGGSTGMKEQDVLDEMIKEGVFGGLNLTARFLDTLFFSGFCQDSSDFRAVATVHANCCRTINAKVADLTVVIRDWKRFRGLSSSNNQTTELRWSTHELCIRSWS